MHSYQTSENTPENNRNSIRYDVTFLECLLRYTDAQLEPESNPGGDAATPAQCKAQRDALCSLCDMIDLYAERLADTKNETGRGPLGL